MAQIPGWIWLVVGVLVVGFSWTSEQLRVFFYVGLVFVIVGIAKLVFAYITREKAPAVQQPVTRHSYRSPAHPVVPSSSLSSPAASVCPACKNKVHANQRFCHMCGLRLK